jgi:hypothetical protein
MPARAMVLQANAQPLVLEQREPRQPGPARRC